MKLDDYESFIRDKSRKMQFQGVSTKGKHFPSSIFDFQKAVVLWSLKKGRSAIFADTGLGKTLMELSWANTLHKEKGASVIVIAPLAVSHQFKTEAEKFDVKVSLCSSSSDVVDGINITNYEKIHKFDFRKFKAVVLDESSILKAYHGSTRNHIIDECKDIPYRLACTATPSPNDFMELGNHAEFLGVCSYTDMLSTFFVHDGGDTAKWRLKGHAESEFWNWVCEWSVMFRHPRDLGYDMSDFDLPELKEHFIYVDTDIGGSDSFFPKEACSMSDRIKARRDSIDARIAKAVSLTPPKGPFVWWCNLNEESKRLSSAIPDAVELTGSDSDDVKVQKLKGFAKGHIRVLVTKPLICGHGLNWQHCRATGFVGLTDSFEQTYQAVRRFWRFGQKHDVDVYYVSADVERSVMKNILRKHASAEKMRQGMLNGMISLSKNAVSDASNGVIIEDPREFPLPRWL